MSEYTEGIERFNKVVSYMGLYVPPEDQMLIDQNNLNADENGSYPPVYAYVSQECYEKNCGFLIAYIDEQVYMCYETEYINDKLYCSGSVPAWCYNDDMLIEHLSNLCKEYKADLVRKRKAKMLEDFE
ncbi:MAG: hypothetical protein MJ211_09555 [Bacteroidales bacterium]|nr:hypothetical protein [Bacteroidales bacterium]